jgi:hypothetical protein
MQFGDAAAIQQIGNLRYVSRREHAKNICELRILVNLSNKCHGSSAVGSNHTQPLQATAIELVS